MHIVILKKAIDKCENLSSDGNILLHSLCDAKHLTWACIHCT